MTMTMLAGPRTASGLPAIEPGSVAAQALYHLWHGAPAVVVSAPPGAGKTHLVATIAPHLTTRAGLTVAAAAQTRSQAIDLANRLAETGLNVNLLPSARDQIGSRGNAYFRRPVDLARSVSFKPIANSADAQVQVANAAKWRSTKHEVDLLIVDEAWQCTWAHLRELASLSSQFLLIGDPGQIDPTIASDTSRWDANPQAPHHPGPVVLARSRPDDVVELTMPSTRRCGPMTAAALAPLYEFPFTSERIAKHITIAGEVQSELAQKSINATCESDPLLYDAVASEALRFASGTLHLEGHQPAPVDAARVCVGVADVTDTSAIRARLPHDTQIVVDTLERLQGLEFDATVLLDPMAGRAQITNHDGDTGRLCVGLSRHTSACTIITTPDVVPTLIASGTKAGALGAAVRSSIQETSL